MAKVEKVENKYSVVDKKVVNNINSNFFIIS